MFLCDVHVDNIRRYGYHDLKQWSNDNRNLYIGRKGIVFCKDCNGNKERFPKEDSIWANPYKAKDFENIKSCLLAYYNYIMIKINNENLYEELYKLKGKFLGCWCVGDKIVTYSPNIDEWICHGQVLMYIVNLYFS